MNERNDDLWAADVSSRLSWCFVYYAHHKIKLIKKLLDNLNIKYYLLYWRIKR